MKILILDDDKNRLMLFKQKLIGAIVTCVENVSDCIKELEKDEQWDYVFLDHDLDNLIYVPSGPGTGYEVALWIKNHPEKKPTNIILHTCNDEGAENIKRELPEAIFLKGLFMMDFSLKDLNNIKGIV